MEITLKAAVPVQPARQNAGGQQVAQTPVHPEKKDQCPSSNQQEQEPEHIQNEVARMPRQPVAEGVGATGGEEGEHPDTLKQHRSQVGIKGLGGLPGAGMERNDDRGNLHGRGRS